MSPSAFRATLRNWYAVHRRSLPWRDVGNPYLTWISEIILQQTRIDQGTDYYLRFVERFPTVECLATADEDEVLKLWEGLGYYSRARNLHSAAREIARKGAFPRRYEDVHALKGVGPYTAAAICSLAYGEPYATVDGNVIRVLSRIFGIDKPVDSTPGRREIDRLASQLLDMEHPADHNQALMDFGALQCTPTHPNCACCPMQTDCQAFQSGIVDLLPIKQKRQPQRHRFFTFFYIRRDDGHTLIHRRGDRDIWKGLYEPFSVETDEGHRDTAFSHPFIAACMAIKSAVLRPLRHDVKHVLTHQVLHADFFRIEIPSGPSSDRLMIPENFRFIPHEEVSSLALPVLFSLSEF